MAISDFTGQNIQDTYQKVVQTDGTNLADGTGSLLPISINGNDVTISGSLTANEYIVSSSVTNITIATLSGSTDFGDDTGDTHKLTGSLFISGTYVGINNDNPSYMLDVGGTIHTTQTLNASGIYSSFGTFTSNINANGNIVGDNATNISGINTLNIIGNATLGNATTDAHTVNGTLNASRKLSSTTMVEAPTGSFKRLKGDTTLATGLFIDGTITASGAISSSGYLFGSNATIAGNIFLGGNNRILYVNDDITLPDTGLKVVGNITASSDISASGTVEASGYKVNGIDALAMASNNLRVGEATFDAVDINNSIVTIGGESGDITLRHVTASGNISASGDITASGFFGDGSGLTNVSATLPSGVISGSSQLPSGIISGAAQLPSGTVSGSAQIADVTLTTAAQTNITSVGILTGGSIGSGFGSINVGGNAITTTGTVTTGPIIATSNITASGIHSSANISSIGNISSSGHIIANYFDSKVAATGYKLSGAKILYVDSSIYKLGRAPSKINITGSNITLDGPVTASGNISSSATIIGNIISGSTISGSFVGDGSGITNLVTTANVTTAGALMDSEVDADIKTLVLPASTTISTFGASLIDDAAASNARTTLGLGTVATTAASDYATLAGTQTFSGNNTFSTPITASSHISSSGNLESSGFIIAKIPMIQLNSTDDSTNMYQDYSGTGGGTTIEWDKEEIKDSDFFTHSTSTNPDRITAIYGGRYEISYIAVFNGDGSGDQRAMPTIKIFVNGSWHTAGGTGARYANNVGYLRRTGGINNVANTGQYIIEVDAGDYIQLASGYQANFGANQGTSIELQIATANIGYTKITIKKIG